MIRLLLFIVIGVLVLSFFGISLQGLVNSPLAQANFSYLWHLLLVGWTLLVTSIRTDVLDIQSKFANFRFMH